MARPLRLEFPGSLWHVTTRGNGRQDIVRDDFDRERFVALLGRCVTRFRWKLFAYVLMSNHFHLLLELRTETLSRGMQWLNGSYSQAFNRRHRRVGHLFQGRFHGALIEKESYFAQVLRYVVLNPVRAHLAARADEYRWSSHLAVIGEIAAPEWLAVDDVLSRFAADKEQAQARYRHFVHDAVGIVDTPWRELVRQMYLGTDDWMVGVRARVEEKLRSDDHPQEQRLVGAPTMSQVIEAVAGGFEIQSERIRNGRNSIPRLLAAWIGSNEALLTNREVAAGLRLRSSGYVSTLIRHCEKELSRDSRLRNRLDRCVSTLRSRECESKL